MKQIRVDWHIHTTLSPCCSLLMDPLTILERSKRRGLDVIGITDHNSTLQARQMKMEFCGSNLMILTGAEVTTREEIHCLAFFDDIVALDEFQVYLDEHLISIPNNPIFFGDQVVVDFQGNIVYEEKRLLISALDQSLEEVGEFVHYHGGIFIPAHINRPSFSLLSQLGIIPMNMKADAVEWVPGCKGGLGCEDEPVLNSFPIVYSSDAHCPEDIGQRFTGLQVENPGFRDIKEGLKMLLNSRNSG